MRVYTFMYFSSQFLSFVVKYDLSIVAIFSDFSFFYDEVSNLSWMVYPFGYILFLLTSLVKLLFLVVQLF